MDAAHPTREELLYFLSRLPVTDDVDLWLEHFRTSLCDLLTDVDRVSIFVNFIFDLGDIELKQVALVQQIEGGSTDSPGRPMPDAPSEAFEYFRSQGHHVDRYQLPVTLNYLVNGTDRFASIYLWRQQDQPPISEHTIALVISLRALTVNMLQNLIRGYQLRNPDQKVFIGSLARLVQVTGITSKQNQILIHLLKDDRYEKIARTTGVSVSAVKDTVRRLYRRAGVASLRELYVKYFIPQL